MALTNDSPETGIIKTDRQGRFRYSEDYKRQAVEAFEQSGLSGIQFAKKCGVKYPTFATWVQKRRKQGAESSGKDPSEDAPKFLLAEIREEDPGAGVRVSLPGGLEARAETREEVVLLAELIKALA